MKRFIAIFAFTSSVFCFSQNKIDSISINNSKKDAFYKSGKGNLQKDFHKALSYAIDGNYVVYGTMTFTFLVNENGKAKIIDVKPKLKNSQKLIDDLNYLLKKSNKNWESAQLDNKPIQSTFQYQIKFNTEVYDHD